MIYPGTLAEALVDTVNINANDLVYLHEGVYSGDYLSTLIGSGAYPITIQAYPGERAIIDGAFTARGQSVTFVDLEFTYTGWTNRATLLPGSTPADIPYTKALANEGFGVNFINCIIHDQTSPGFQSLSKNALFYGCVIFYNGWSGPDRGHGHGLYVQNDAPFRKIIKDCIIFDNFGYGIHAYTEGGGINYLTLEGNTCFRNGSLYGGYYSDILVGGYTIALDPVLQDNMTYNIGACNLGYVAGCTGAILINNYFPQGLTKVNAGISSEIGNYYGENGLGNAIFLRPNLYNSARANLTIYNASQAPSVVVDISALGWTGGSIRVRNVQDYFTNWQIFTPGATLEIDMINQTIGTPVEWNHPLTTFPDFGCFVLEHLLS